MDDNWIPPLQRGIDEFHSNFDDALFENIHAEWRMSKAKTKNPEGEAFWRKNGPKYVENYYKWRLANPHYVVATLPNGAPAIEVAINVKVPGSNIVLKGSIDRVFKDLRDDTRLIVDNKSGSSAQPSPMQLGFYRLGWKQLFDEDIRWGAFFDARKGQLDAIYDLDQFPPDMISRWLRDADKIVSQNLLIPNVSRDCSWCGVKDHCYVWNPALPRPDFNSDVEA